MQDSASFWTDIKKLEEQLTKTPDSFCFARLSEVYLKLGLIDDALHVARQGVIKHPGYLSGHRALSLACHAKGLNDEALVALKFVTDALPEDVPSQKLLGRLYAAAGNQSAACKTFLTALEFAPEDVECQIELGALRRTVSALELDDDEEIIEDLEIVEEFDSTDDGQTGYVDESQKILPELDTCYGTNYDPLSTTTLAELYVSQGFIHKALDIYRAILADNPDNQIIAVRVTELEAIDAGLPEPDSEIDETFDEEAEYEPASGMSAEEFFQPTELVVLSESVSVNPVENQQRLSSLVNLDSGASVVPHTGIADNSLNTLNGWLENIRRIKSCR